MPCLEGKLFPNVNKLCLLIVRKIFMCKRRPLIMSQLLAIAWIFGRTSTQSTIRLQLQILLLLSFGFYYILQEKSKIMVVSGVIPIWAQTNYKKLIDRKTSFLYNLLANSISFFLNNTTANKKKSFDSEKLYCFFLSTITKKYKCRILSTPFCISKFNIYSKKLKLHKVSKGYHLYASTPLPTKGPF